MVRPKWVIPLTLEPPSLKNNTADVDRLLEGLKAHLKTDSVCCDPHLLEMLPEFLRRHAYRARCVLFNEAGHWILLSVLDPADPAPVAGLALDIGTSTIVMALLDLQTGEKIGETAFPNPQIAFGPDILTRIHYAEKASGGRHLQNLLMDALNESIASLCRDYGFERDRIFIVSTVGNTAMIHFFLNLPTRHLIREPYIPAVNRIPLLEAAAVGIRIHPAGRVYVFPNIGSYCGGDLFAGILYSGMHERARLSLLVDVGTNAEVVLGNREWLMACAGAAGPALEGGVTRMGMLAGPGVIDRVSIDPRTREIRIRTIGNQAPIGICGSGLIDLAAQLFQAGMIDIRGKWIRSACQDHLREEDAQLRFVLVPARETGIGEDLTLAQAELDSLIRSKAAMYTILETLAQTVGVGLNEIADFYIAGMFGSVIDPESAITLGMLPDLPRDRFHVLGNSALGGAHEILLSPRALSQVAGIRDRTTYLELNVNSEFMNRFNAARFLPHTDISRFPTAKRRLTPRPASFFASGERP